MTYHWISNLFAFIVVLIVAIAHIKYVKSPSANYIIFNLILFLTLGLLVFDVLARHDGNITSYAPLFNQVGNFVLFLLAPIVPSLWAFVVYSQLHADKKFAKCNFMILGIINLAHFLILMFNFKTGWYYTIDSNNIYHRGPLFYLSSLTTFIILMYSLIIIILQKNKIDKKLFNLYLIFPLPALFGFLMQIAVPTMDLAIKGLTVSLLFYFIFILTRQTTIDYLTSIYNRKGLDEYLTQRIRSASKNTRFIGVMLDLNSFKEINDKFGHPYGDEVLKKAVMILQENISKKDFLARYGGDEFFIVLETEDYDKALEKIEVLKTKFRNFSSYNEVNYQLDFAFGLLRFDYEKYKTIQDFKKDVDELLYENKKNRKISQS